MNDPETVVDSPQLDILAASVLTARDELDQARAALRAAEKRHQDAAARFASTRDTFLRSIQSMNLFPPEAPDYRPDEPQYDI